MVLQYFDLDMLQDPVTVCEHAVAALTLCVCVCVCKCVCMCGCVLTCAGVCIYVRD